MSEKWITVSCVPQLNRLHRRDEVEWAVEIPGHIARVVYGTLREAMARARGDAKRLGLPIRQIDAYKETT